MVDAMEKGVVITTPTNLFGLCKVVAYGWRIDTEVKNADRIAELGRELHKRLAVMGGHVQAMGKALEAAITRYNQFVGSLELQVLSQARRFEDLEVDHQAKEIVEIEPIELTARVQTKLAFEAADAPALTAPEPAPTSAP